MMVPLENVRWKLALVWFSTCSFVFILLIVQSLGGAYGDELQRLWGWALPNFLPTLALMLSVFAADALRPTDDAQLVVRQNFYRLSMGLSLFYLVILLITLLMQPIANFVAEGDTPARIEMLETSNLWLGPIQGLVVVALGVLFFLREDKK